MSDTSVCNLQYAEHKSVISDFLTTCYSNEKYLNVVFICKDNIYVEVHQSVIICVSNYLKRIIRNRLNEVIFISLPDVESSVIKTLVNFLYKGVAKVNRQELVYLEDLLIFLDIRISNCEIQPCTTVTSEALANIEVSYVKDVDSVTPALFAVDRTDEPGHCLQERNNLQGAPTNEILKEICSSITDTEPSYRNHSDDSRKKILPDTQKNTTKALKKRDINVTSPDVRPTSILSETTDVHSSAPVLGGSSDVPLQGGPCTSFSNDEESLSIDNSDIIHTISSDEEADDSNQMAIEQEGDVNSHSSKNLYTDTFQGNRDASFEFNSSSVKEGQNLRRKRCFSVDQKLTLEEVFKKNKYLTEEFSENLAKSLGVSTSRLAHWFYWKRYKDASERQKLSKKEYFSKEQKLVLEEVYKTNKYLNEELREKLVKTLGISRYRLANWFGWKRYKDQSVPRNSKVGSKSSFKRTLTETQRCKLKEAYGKTKYLSEELSESLASSLGIPIFTVKKWFSNERKKDGITISGYMSSRAPHSTFTSIEEPQYIDSSSDASDRQLNILNVIEKTIDSNFVPSQQENVGNSDVVSAQKDLRRGMYIFSEDQKSVLRKVYNETKILTEELREKLTRDLKISGDTLNAWFKNQRQKDQLGAANVVLQAPVSLFASNEEPQTIDYPEAVTSNISNEELHRSNERNLEQEINIDHPSSQKRYVDTLLRNGGVIEDTNTSDSVLANAEDVFLPERMSESNKADVTGNASTANESVINANNTTDSCVAGEDNTLTSSERPKELFTADQKESFTEEQLCILEQKFEEYKRPTLQNLLGIAKQLNVSGDCVILWFKKRKEEENITAEKKYRINEYQKSELKKVYLKTKYLNQELREELHKTLGIPRLSLIRWFIRERYKDRCDSSAFKGPCSSLTNNEESQDTKISEDFEFSDSNEEPSSSNEMEEKVNVNCLSSEQIQVNALQEIEGVYFEERNTPDAVTGNTPILRDLLTKNTGANDTENVAVINESVMDENETVDSYVPGSNLLKRTSSSENITDLHNKKHCMQREIRQVEEEIYCRCCREKFTSIESLGFHRCDSYERQMMISRWQLSEKQMLVLEEVYKENKYLNEELRNKLVETLGISKYRLTNWFSLKRYKDKFGSSSKTALQQQGSSFDSIDKSQDIDCSEDFRSSPCNEEHDSSDDLFMEKEIDIDCLSSENVYVDTLQEKGGMQFEDNNTSNVLSGSSAGASFQVATITSNENIQDIDNSKDFQSSTCNEERDSSDDMANEEEIDMKCLSSENVYVDTLHDKGDENLEVNMSDVVSGSSAIAELQGFCSSYASYKKSQSINYPKTVQPNSLKIINLSTLQDKIIFFENRNTPDGATEADSMLVDDDPANAVISYNLEKRDQEGDTCLISMPKAEQIDNPDQNSMIVIPGDVQERNLMEQIITVKTGSLPSILPTNHHSPVIGASNTIVPSADAPASAVMSYNTNSESQNDNTLVLAMSKPLQVSNQHNDDAHDDDNDDDIIFISDDDEEEKNSQIYNQPLTAWNIENEGQQHVNLERHFANKPSELNKQQRLMLENAFRETKYLNDAQRTMLSTSVGISGKALTKWFSRQRERDRRVQKKQLVTNPAAAAAASADESVYSEAIENTADSLV